MSTMARSLLAGPAAGFAGALAGVQEFQGSASEWDAFVGSQADATNYHLYGWKSVIERTFGHECLYLAARDSTAKLTGVLPLVRVRSALFGHYLVSLPWVSYGGPLGDRDSVIALVERACAMARRGRVKLLELRSRTELPISLPVSHRKISVVLDLTPGDAAAVSSRVGSRLRTYVRRTREAGVSVSFGRDRLADFYEVYTHRMRELGTPAQPRRLFDALADTFGDYVWVGCAYLEGRPVAAGVGLRWAREIEVTWAASRSESPEIRPNALLYWAFIERAANEGLCKFNFGRSTPGSGTHEFKRRWGGRDETLWWYDLARDPGAITPSPNEGAFAWGPRLWRHLPMAVTRALGPRIIRYIP